MDPVRPLNPYIILRENIERDEGGGYVREDHAACGHFFFQIFTRTPGFANWKAHVGYKIQPQQISSTVPHSLIQTVR